VSWLRCQKFAGLDRVQGSADIQFTPVSVRQMQTGPKCEQALTLYRFSYLMIICWSKYI